MEIRRAVAVIYLGLCVQTQAATATRTATAKAKPAASPSSTGPASATARPERLVLDGRDFESLSDWVRLHSLTLSWDGRSRQIRASNRSQRFDFLINGREICVNGINVWLSLPVTVSGGRPFISSLDVRTTLQPLVQPAHNKPGRKVTVICLDPGHGGRQPGNQVGDHAEKTYALLLARKVRSLLRAAGLKVIMTRDADTAVDLDDRPDFARRHKADAFVSLHYNATPQTTASARGVETYCLTPAGVLSTNSRGDDDTPTQAYVGNLENNRSLLLAYQIQKALVNNLAANDRGVRRARFAVLRPATMPAALVEAGFMTDPADAKTIWNDTSRNAQARAIVNGILAYKRLVER